MLRRAAIAALVFSFIVTISGSLRASAAYRHVGQPRFCFGSVPIACAPAKPLKAAQAVGAAVVIGQAAPARRNLWRNHFHVRLSLDYDFVQTNTLGAQGSGNAIDANVKLSLPGGRFSDTFRFSRYNIQVPTFHFCPTCGAFVSDDENDDYAEYDNDLDYWCPDDDEWGFGLSYVYYHPIYAQEAVNTSGFGFGIDRAPKYRTDFSPYGSLYYYPSVSGSASNNFVDFRPSYQIWRYEAGVNYRPVLTNPLSFQLGLKGESWIGKGQSSSARVIGGYIGSSYSW